MGRSDLSARNDADDLQPVGFRQLALLPLVASEGDAVVFDEGCWRGKVERPDERRDILRADDLARLAVDQQIHAVRIARSQSFQTGSSPDARSTAVISAGER